MIYILTLLSLMLLSFVVVYFIKRRSGLLILALATGSILATQWSEQLSQYIMQLNIHTTQLVVMSTVTVLLIVLPMVLVMKSAKTASGRFQCGLHAVLCAIAVVIFVEKPIRLLVATDALASQVVNVIEIYRAIIITICLVAAILDVASYSLRVKSKKHT